MVRAATTPVTTRKPLGLEDLTWEQVERVAELEAGDDTPPAGPVRGVRVAQPLVKVIPLRMSDAQWRVLAREAEDLGLRPTTLMRMWVLERLRDAERGHRADPTPDSP